MKPGIILSCATVTLGLTLATTSLPLCAQRSDVAAIRTTNTAIDWAIDVALNQRASALHLTSAEVHTVREQYQFEFQSLSPSQRESIVTAIQSAGDEEQVARTLQMVAAAVEANARQALAASRAKAGSVNAKLGATDTDLVFTATVGPCRVADTRNSITIDWPGQLVAFNGRQIWAYGNVSGFDYSASQGGTGLSGSGNCTGTTFTGTAPVDVVATITVANTISQGALRVWDGTETLTVGAGAAWSAGVQTSNTTVIPLNRTGIPFPNSGPEKRDFGIYNNSTGPVDVIVDVVGYFVHNKATALECATVVGAPTGLVPGTSQFISTPACPAGFTAVAGQPNASVLGVYTGTINTTGCRITNTTNIAQNASCDVLCCRLPGI